jgi:hypothetical protein
MSKGIRFTKGFKWDPVAKMVEHGYPNPHMVESSLYCPHYQRKVLSFFRFVNVLNAQTATQRETIRQCPQSALTGMVCVG